MFYLGEQIAILRRTQTGTDAMGEPVYAWQSEVVDNCLIKPLDPLEISDKTRPDGVKVQFCVALPKTYTESMEGLRGGRVALLERGMSADDVDSAYKISGEPAITKPCPTKWNITFEIGRADG